MAEETPLSRAIIKVLTDGPAHVGDIYVAVRPTMGVKLTPKEVSDWLRDHHDIVDFDGRKWLLRKAVQSTGSIIGQLKRELELANDEIRKLISQKEVLKKELDSYRRDQDANDKPSRDDLDAKIAAMAKEIEQLRVAGEKVAPPARTGFTPHALHILNAMRSHLAGAADNIAKLVGLSEPAPVHPSPPEPLYTLTIKAKHNEAPPFTVEKAEAASVKPANKEPRLIAALRTLGKATIDQLATHLDTNKGNIYAMIQAYKARLIRQKEPGKDMVLSLAQP